MPAGSKAILGPAYCRTQGYLGLAPGMTQVRTAHDPGLFWVLHCPWPKAILDPAQGRTQGNLGLALGFCTLKDRRLFWVLYLGSCTRPDLGPAPAGSKAIWVLHRNGLLARRSGLQTLPRGFADPRLAGCRLVRPGVAARRTSLPPVPKAGQTPCQVSVW